MACDEVWLVRHGETEWSRDGRHTSTTDLPLTARRRAGGRGHPGPARRRRLRARADLARGSGPGETAELAGHPEAEVDDDLAEWDYGDLEGETTEEIRETYPGWTIWTRAGARRRDRGRRSRRGSTGWSPAVAPPTAGSWSSGTATALRALAARWLELPVTDGRHLRLDTATVSVLGYERETPVVLRWNS